MSNEILKWTQDKKKIYIYIRKKKIRTKISKETKHKIINLEVHSLVTISNAWNWINHVYYIRKRKKFLEWPRLILTKRKPRKFRNNVVKISEHPVRSFQACQAHWKQRRSKEAPRRKTYFLKAYPDRFYHNFRASKSGDWRILCSSWASCDGSWSSNFVTGSGFCEEKSQKRREIWESSTLLFEWFICSHSAFASETCIGVRRPSSNKTELGWQLKEKYLFVQHSCRRRAIVASKCDIPQKVGQLEEKEKRQNGNEGGNRAHIHVVIVHISCHSVLACSFQTTKQAPQSVSWVVN